MKALFFLIKVEIGKSCHIIFCDWESTLMLEEERQNQSLFTFSEKWTHGAKAQSEKSLIFFPCITLLKYPSDEPALQSTSQSCERRRGLCPFQISCNFSQSVEKQWNPVESQPQRHSLYRFFFFVLFHFILFPACSSLNRAKYLRSLCSAFHIPVLFLAEQQRINNGSALGWVRERVEALYCAQAR